MKKSARRAVWNFICYTLGIAFSVGLTAVTVYAVYSFTIKSYTTGKEIADQYTAKRPFKEIEITLEDETTIDEVADILYKNKIITNQLLFKAENILKNTDENFAGGTFTVNTDMDSNELNNALRRTIVLSKDRRITIKEGWALRDIAVYLEGQEIVTADEFLEACESSQFKYYFLDDLPDRPNRLEGYLFPDTYMIAENSTPEMIIDKLLTRFEEIYSPEYSLRAEELGLTIDQVITIASIIEKEIRVSEERALASAVIKNRIEDAMNLQMCSTVLYALDKHKDRLLEEDLLVESPYNTYLNAGLPLGPISNPGEACIRAALYPSESDALYFVVKDEETGEHVFTNNYDEFVSAKAMYNQKF